MTIIREYSAEAGCGRNALSGWFPHGTLFFYTCLPQ